MFHPRNSRRTESTESPAGADSTGRPQSVGRVASRAFGWSFLNTAVGRFGTLAIGIVLARVLGPAQFGTFAVATVALFAVLSFNELGVSLAIVRWPQDPRSIAPTVTTISVITSALLTVAVWLAAPSFSAAMGDPGATAVVRVMTLSILINGVVATPAALLQREFKQRRRMVIDQVNTWLGAGVSLGLALLGWGAMSLAIGRLSGAGVSALLFILSSPQRLRFGFDRSVARALLRFGLPLAGSSIIVFASGYADQLVTGKILGSQALGFYVLAFNLSSWPVTIFSQPLRSVAPAAFSRLQHDVPTMNRAFRSILTVLACISLPACLTLAGTAPAIVLFVYGSVWAPAAGVLLVLGVGAGIRICFELTYDYLVVRGRSGAILVVQAIWIAVMVPALIIGARWHGIVGVAIAQVVVAAVVVIPVYAGLLHRSGVKISGLSRAVALPSLVAVVIGAVDYEISREVESALVACLLAGLLCLLAIGALILGRRTLIRELLAVGRRSDPAPEAPSEDRPDLLAVRSPDLTNRTL